MPIRLSPDRALLRDAGWQVNDKRVERLWRREGLKVPGKQPKRNHIAAGYLPVAMALSITSPIRSAAASTSRSLT